MKLTLSAPAKINLTLAITGLREDGYHLLSSVMQTLSLSDTVVLETIPQGITLSCDRKGIPTDQHNLCWKAAKRYLDAAGVQEGVAITLYKCIPDGAGMGGGSSDAAAVLKGLAALYPAQVNLAKLAATIGADVPFFLTGGTCLCEGVGEDVTPIPFPAKSGLFCVVTKPEASLSTPVIYQQYDEMKGEFSPSCRRLLAQFESGAVFSLLHNDLELPAITLLPEICAYKEALLNAGADCAMMTGSGSAVFGLFREEKAARSAQKKLMENGKNSYFCTLT